MNANADQFRIPAAALWLGVAGVIPFLASVAGLAVPQWRPVALFALITYGAVILSFLGGIRWGLAIARMGRATAGPTVKQLGLSVIPALIGWGALLLPPGPGLLVLTLAFAVMLILDRAAARSGEAPSWYPRLRVPLSVAAIASLFLGWLVTL